MADLVQRHREQIDVAYRSTGGIVEVTSVVDRIVDTSKVPGAIRIRRLLFVSGIQWIVTIESAIHKEARRSVIIKTQQCRRFPIGGSTLRNSVVTPKASAQGRPSVFNG